MAKKKFHHLGMSAMIASMILTGAIVVLNKVILDEMSATQMSALRFSIAVLLMISLMRFRAARISRKDFSLVVVKSILNVAEFILFYLGLQRLDASLASVLAAMSPLLIYFGAIRYLHEKAKKRTLIGLIIALLGAVIISVTDSGTIGAIVDTQGLIYISSSIILTAVTTLISKSLVDHINPKAIMKANTLFMTIGFWVVLFINRDLPGGFPALTWVYIAISGVGLFVIYALYYQSLKYVRAEDTGVVSYLQYLASIVGAIIFLGDRPAVAFWIGGGLILLGILVAETNTHLKKHRKLHLHLMRHHK